MISSPGKTIYHRSWYAEEYDRDRYGGSFGRLLETYEIDTFFSLLKGVPGRVLDLGAGTGKLSLSLSRECPWIISSDFSLEMIEIARRKSKVLGIDLKPVVCDAENLSFRDDSFDCVVCSRVLMHLKDASRGIAELCRVSRSAVVDFPPKSSFGGIQGPYRRMMSSSGMTKGGYRTYTLRKIADEFRRHGFEIVETRRHFFLPIAFHRLMNRPELSLKIERNFRRIGLVGLFGAPVTIKAVSRKTEHGMNGSGK